MADEPATERSVRFPTALPFALLPYAATGVLALGFGWQDAINAPQPAYRVQGFMFFVIGLFLVGATICLVIPRLRATWGGALRVPASIAAASVALYLLLNSIGSQGAPSSAWWGFLLTAALVALWSMVATRAHPVPPRQPARDRSGRFRKAARRLRSVPVEKSSPQPAWLTRATSLGLSVTLLWSVVQFIYTNAINKAAVGADLIVTTDLKPVDTRNGRRLFEADVDIKNRGSSRVQVVASLYTVSGEQLEGTDASDNSFYGRAVRQQRIESSVNRYAAVGKSELLQYGALLPDAWYFEPAEEFHRRLTVSFPADRTFDHLKISTTLAVGRGERIILTGSPNYGPKAITSSALAVGKYELFQWPLRPLGTIRSLTKGRQAVRALFIFQEREKGKPQDVPGLPILEVCIDRKRSAAWVRDTLEGRPDLVCPLHDNYQGRLADFYGLVYTGSQDEVPLAQGGPPPPGSK